MPVRQREGAKVKAKCRFLNHLPFLWALGLHLPFDAQALAGCPCQGALTQQSLWHPRNSAGPIWELPQQQAPDSPSAPNRASAQRGAVWPPHPGALTQLDTQPRHTPLVWRLRTPVSPGPSRGACSGKRGEGVVETRQKRNRRGEGAQERL